MAANIYRIRTGATATRSGARLLGALETLQEAFDQVKRERLAIIQEKDGAAGNASDYATPAAIYGFVDGSDAIQGSVAMAAFTELDSFVGNGAAALEQCCARFRQ